MTTKHIIAIVTHDYSFAWITTITRLEKETTIIRAVRAQGLIETENAVYRFFQNGSESWQGLEFHEVMVVGNPDKHMLARIKGKLKP